MKFARMLLVVMAVSATAFVPMLGQEQEDLRKPHSRRACPEDGRDDRVHDRRGDVGLARCLARRTHDPLRGARRSLHAPYRGRAGNADHGRLVVREPAHLFARRQDHRLPDRSHGVENLWIADADGSNPRAISKDTRTNDRPQIMLSPAWTPDGAIHRRVEVAAARARDLWPLHVSPRRGHRRARLVRRRRRSRDPMLRDRHRRRRQTRWARSSRPTAASSITRSAMARFTYNAQFPLWQVYRHDRETGDASQVTNARGSALRPAISPDGKWLVYGTRHKTQTGLRVRNLDTGAERWLAYPVTRDDQESRATPRHASALRLHARWQVARRAGRRQDSSHRFRQR